MNEVDDVLNTELAWSGADQVRLAIGTGRTQVVAGKGPMTVALWCCNDSKVGRSLGLELLPEGILHCIKRDTRIMQDRNSSMLIEVFLGRGWGVCVTVDWPSNLHSKRAVFLGNLNRTVVADLELGHLVTFFIFISHQFSCPRCSLIDTSTNCSLVRVIIFLLRNLSL
jgi:hypothetical protein